MPPPTPTHPTPTQPIDRNRSIDPRHTQALRLVKADLEATKQAKAALAAESETKDATIATLQSKVGVVRGWMGWGVWCACVVMG